MMLSNKRIGKYLRVAVVHPISHRIEGATLILRVSKATARRLRREMECPEPWETIAYRRHDNRTFGVYHPQVMTEQ
jgi:hypothetical protein